MGVGAGCQAQIGYAVLQALVDPSQVSDALGLMMLGIMQYRPKLYRD